MLRIHHLCEPEPGQQSKGDQKQVFPRQASIFGQDLANTLNWILWNADLRNLLSCPLSSDPQKGWGKKEMRENIKSIGL